MLMEDYIEVIRKLKDILNKINAVEIITPILKQINSDIFNIGVIGNNIKSNQDICDILTKHISNIRIEEIKNLDYMGYHSVIIILDAVQPISKGDIELYEKIHKKCNNIEFILKRTELVDEEDQQELLEYVENKLFNIIGNSRLIIWGEKDYVINLVNKFSNLDRLKLTSTSYKVNILVNESIKYINDNIDKIENWDKHKQHEIYNVQRQIEDIKYFAEGIALFINEILNKLKNEETEVTRTFNLDLINGLSYVKFKYLLQEDKVQDDSLSIEENMTRQQLLEFIKMERNKVNNEIINKINNKKKEIEDLLLKETPKIDMMILKEALKEINNIKEGRV